MKIQPLFWAWLIALLLCMIVLAVKVSAEDFVTEEDVAYWEVLRSCRPFADYYKICDDGVIRYQSTNYEVMDIQWILSEGYKQNPSRRLNSAIWLDKIGDMYE